jgi:hypothetical protein
VARMRETSNLYSGTQLQQTALGPGTSVRIRRMFVASEHESRDGAELIAHAKDEFLSNGRNLYAPGLNFLPLTRISGKQIARNLVELTVDYEVVQDFVGPGTELATFQSAILPVKIWSAPLPPEEEPADGQEPTEPSPIYVRGMPFGRTLKGLSPGSVHTEEQQSTCPSKIHQRTAVRIKVKQTLFGVNPMSLWGELVNTTGQGKVAGFDCAEGTLLFEGLSSTQTTAGTSDPAGITPPEMTIYTFTLDFAYDPHGFPTQGWQSTDTFEGDDGNEYDGIDDPNIPADVDVTRKTTYTLHIENEYKRGNWTYPV